jgi:hypothetical protein
LRFRSPLLSQSRFLSFPPGTEMVHFPGFARTRLWIRQAVRGFCPRGFPHSEISGSKPACGSPKLIAACHVFLRRLLPRHPPCALSSLTIKLTQSTPYHYGKHRVNLWRHPVLLYFAPSLDHSRSSAGTGIAALIKIYFAL